MTLRDTFGLEGGDSRMTLPRLESFCISVSEYLKLNFVKDAPRGVQCSRA